MDGARDVTRRGNIQHGQKRRMSWEVRTPIMFLIFLIPVLIWELLMFTGVV